MAKTKTTTEPKKTECPITRAQFEKTAKPLLVTISGANMPQTEDGQTVPKKFAVGVYRDKKTGEIGFKSGNLGFNLSEKMDMEFDGVPVKVQVGLNITIVNSKDAK